MRWHPTVNIVELALAFLPVKRGREWGRREPSDIDRGMSSTEASESIELARGKKASLSNETEQDGEAGAGIEPANSGFADRDLTTWLPRRLPRADNIVIAALVSSPEHRYVDVRCCEHLKLRFNPSTNLRIVTA
jgi:hypothetical protein